MEKFLIQRQKGSDVTRQVRLRSTGEVIGGIIPVYARGFLATAADSGKERMFGSLRDAGKWILRMKEHGNA